jgi:hypothetical protein
MPDRFLQSGRLHLDLTAENVLELTRSLQELSDLDTINVEGAIEFDVPYTTKNDIIARFVRRETLIGNTYDPLRIIVSEGSVQYLFFTEIQFTGANDAGASYTAKIQGGDAHWLTYAAKKLLNTVELGTFEFTAANLLTNWTNDNSYQDGDQGVWFPLVHYGGWFEANNIVVEDFRPWFHALSILQKGFCEGGWSFRCPFLETEAGRKAIVYILSKSLGTNPDDLEYRRFSANTTTADSSPIVVFENEEFDNSNSYNPATGIYSGAMEGTFTAVVSVRMNFADTGNELVTIELIREDADGSITVLGGQDLFLATGDTATFSITSISTALIPGSSVYVLKTTVADSDAEVYAGQFYNTPTRAIFQDGDILDLKDQIDSDYLLLDFLKGIAHLCNGRFKTDFVQKTLYLYCPYDVQWYGEGVDGFFQNTIEDITDLIVPDSKQTQIDRNSYSRYVRLRFKAAGDAYIKNLKAEDREPLFSKYLDLGDGVDDKIQDLPNPFFEPTLNGIITKFSAIPPELVTRNVDIPHLWDNENGEKSFDIAPRIALAFGYVTQVWNDGTPETSRKWKFEGGIADDLPYAFQFPNVPYDDGGTTTDITDRWVYGEDSERDFYTLAYSRTLQRVQSSARVSFTMRTTARRYSREAFQKRYLIYYAGRTSLYRLIEMAGYRTCDSGLIQAVFQPVPYVGDECADNINVDPDTCNNRPRIDVTIDVSGNSTSADADDSGITSPIDTDDWEYSVNGGASWSAYTPPTPIIGEASIIFRRTVSFTDGCPTKVVTRTADFETFCDNNPTITLVYTAGTNTIVATGGGAFNSTIDADDWEYSIDGGAYTPYTEGDPVTGFETITFRRTVQYTNACEDSIVFASYTVGGTICANEPEIIFTEVMPGTCAYILSIGGTLDSSIAATTFQISDNGGVSWRAHNGGVVRRMQDTIVKAIIYYTDDCPLSIITAECL